MDTRARFARARGNDHGLCVPKRLTGAGRADRERTAMGVVGARLAEDLDDQPVDPLLAGDACNATTSAMSPCTEVRRVLPPHASCVERQCSG